MKEIGFSHIKPRSLVDGVGTRTVLFMQGCNIRCPGCQNARLWSFDGGHKSDVKDVARTLTLLAENGQVTISGGEPFAQPQALLELVETLRASGITDLTIYSGYTWEQLLDENNPRAVLNRRILKNVDVLVDGKFEASRDDDFVNLRGSRNQRPIRAKDSLNSVNLLIIEDWDAPALTVDESGNIVLPAGLAVEFAEVGKIKATRMCGQTTGRGA
jgi:anaerobic ribonucleoside-triphosphate reductase activating protein